MGIEQEKSEIKETIQKFFDGFDNFNTELINEAFYSPKIEMLTIHESGKLKKSLVSSFSKWFEKIKNQPDNVLNKEKSKKNIIYIDITGRAANAKVEYIFSTYTWVEYYNLLKIENRWYIVNKVFETLYPE